MKTTITLKDIKLQDDNGRPYAIFFAHRFDENGKEVGGSRQHDWLMVQDGKLVLSSENLAASGYLTNDEIAQTKALIDAYIKV